MIDITEIKNGNHLANYILKILKNNGFDVSPQEKDTIRNINKIYYFIEQHLLRSDCPVVFDTNFSTWIDCAKHGQIDELCNIITRSTNYIDKFDAKEVGFDELIPYLGLNVRYYRNYLETKPAFSDIYYPWHLEIAIPQIKNNNGILYYYTNPFPNLVHNYGCYLIYDKEDLNKIVYIGKSNSNLFKRAIASARERTNTTFSKIELLEMPTHSDTNIYEMYYISKFKPCLNIESVYDDEPSFELNNIFVKHSIEYVKEEIWSSKELYIDTLSISKEEFWKKKDSYLLYNDENLRILRENFNSNHKGIEMYPRRELFEKDGFLCSYHIR